MQAHLFQLLRLGLKTRMPEEEDTSALTRLSESEWETLFDIAKFQGVAGVSLDGITILIDKYGKDYFNHFSNKSFWRRFIVGWAVFVEQSYEVKNMRQEDVISDIGARWVKGGIRMMIMKGMAMGIYYPTPKHRASGDIDCYLFGNYARGNALAREWADRVDENWYKHSQIHYRGELIENHQFFIHTREGHRSRDLNQLLVDTLNNSVELDVFPGTGALLPPPMFNALFLTYHALTHFLEEGLRLKQLLDWALFLRRDADKINWPSFYACCEKYHMIRFAEMATDIAVNYLGIPLNNPQIRANSQYSVRVIHSTLYDKDYVFSSGQSGWRNRWHIIRNMIKYRWKFHMIYQHSVMRQLWFFFFGFVFKTQ